ncbi:hypothetical protein WCX72_06655 [Sulfurimonas sp. HSL1-6]|uniref:hypothetical protein n=1 Tax=Thiomicrolovo immobilis TaxID=3131935 RepID=UPI0031F9D1B6
MNPYSTETNPQLPHQECFAFRLRMLEQGAKELQEHIRRVDDILFKIKTSAITVWIALMGWSFTEKIWHLIPFGLIVILGFWLFEGFFRGIQARYLLASGRLTAFLNDDTLINTSFDKRSFPADTIYPMTFQSNEREKFIWYLKGLIAPSVAILYIFLLFLNIFLVYTLTTFN